MVLILFLLSEFIFTAFLTGNFLFYSCLYVDPLFIPPPSNYISVRCFRLSHSGFCCAWDRLWMKVILTIFCSLFGREACHRPESDYVYLREWWACSDAGLTIYLQHMHILLFLLTTTSTFWLWLPKSYGFYYPSFEFLYTILFLVPYSL